MLDQCSYKSCPNSLNNATATITDWVKDKYTCYINTCKPMVDSKVNFTQAIPNTFVDLINCYQTGSSNLINFLVTLAVLFIIIN